MITLRSLCFLALTAVAASAQTDHLVVSQVYGGGGATTGSPAFNADYVELFNPTSSAIPLAGKSLQYAASAGTSWSVAPLTGTVPAGRYFLIQTNKPAANVVGPNVSPAPDLITPDSSSPASLNLAATAGKIILVDAIAAQTGACPAGAMILDKVGYGTATNCAEGSPTATLANTTSATRTNPCSDTDANSVDFTVGTATPRNTASPAPSCGTTNTPSISVSPTSGIQGQNVGITISGINTNFTQGVTAVSVSGAGVQATSVAVANQTSLTATLTIEASAATGARTLTVQTGGEIATTTFTINAAAGCTVSHWIEQIQGSGDLSPLVAAKGSSSALPVTTTGVVTAVIFNGLFIQQTEWPLGQSDDPTRSNGLFVFTSSQPSAALVGSQVCVTGSVTEFVPSTDPNSAPVTEINTPNTILNLGITAPLPSPVLLTTSLPSPGGAFNQLERYEGMRVSAPSIQVTGPSEDSFGNFFATLTGIPRPFREPGIEQPEPLPVPGLPVWNGNPERLKINSSAQPGTTALQVAAGQILTGAVGPLHFDDRTYTIMPDPGLSVSTAAAVAVPVPAPQPNDLTIANFNLEKFNDGIDDSGPDTPILTATQFNTKLAKASLAIRNILLLPDVLAVEEFEKLSVLQALADRIQADLGSPVPVYDASLIEGNDVSGIDIGFLVKRARVQTLSVTQENKNEAFDGGFLNDRPPLVLKARAARPGSSNFLNFTVIAVHQRSLLGLDDPSSGVRNRDKRARQAESLANLIRTRYFSDNLVVLGDFNAFEFSDGYVDVIGGTRGAPAPASETARPIADLYDPDLTDLGQTYLAPSARISYSFRGNAQMIDHVLVNQALLPRVRQFAIAHLNADFPEGLRTDATRPERVSDHDAPVAYFTLPEPAVDVTVASVPSGLSVLVDGIAYTAPRTFQFAAGSMHTFSTSSPQTLSGTQYNFTSWSDTGTQSHSVTIPMNAVTYTASFTPAGPSTGTFGIAAAVTSRTAGPAADDRVYTVRLTNVGTLPLTACRVDAVAFASPGISLGSMLPLQFGDLPSNGGNSTQPVTANVAAMATRFVMTLSGACQNGSTALPFQTSVTTFR